jgi:hypothetical protein
VGEAVSLRHPGKVRCLGNVASLYVQALRKNGGMARVSAPLGCYDPLDSQSWEQSSPFYPSIGRRSASQGFGTRHSSWCIHLAVGSRDIPPKLYGKERSRLAHVSYTSSSTSNVYFSFLHNTGPILLLKNNTVFYFLAILISWPRARLDENPKVYPPHP